MAPVSPRCWKCGYDLTGLKVEDVCPECSTPVWSAPPGERVAGESLRALYFGVGAAVSFFVFAPLAVALGIVALVIGARAKRMVSTGRADAISFGPARLGRALGWAGVIGGSIVSAGVLATLILA